MSVPARRRVRPALALILLPAVLLPAGPAAADGPVAGATEVVSIDTGGGAPNADSSITHVSSNGRFVTFVTGATDIVGGPQNTTEHVYVTDRLLGITERASVSSSEALATNFSSAGQTTDDGRYVVFASDATNLVATDTNGESDIFVRDRLAGTTVRVSTTAGGAQAVGRSTQPEITPNGTHIAFVSLASNLVAGDPPGVGDVFVKNRLTGSIERVSESTAGADGDATSQSPSISADGRYVAFDSFATTLVLNDLNGVKDAFVRDRDTDTTTRVSLSSAEVPGNQASAAPAVSDDGNLVAFFSGADNLVGGETGDLASDVFVRNRSAGTTERVSVTSAEVKGTDDSFAPSISRDGDRVAFYTNAPNLGAGPASFEYATVVRDRSAGTTTLASVTPAGAPGFGAPAIVSRDGRYVGYHTTAAVPPAKAQVHLRVLTDSTFVDVSSTHAFAEEIWWMIAEGITTGYDDDTFRATNPVTRQAMAAFLYRFAGEPPFIAPGVPTFDDVPTGHPFYKEIEWAASEGLVNGFADGGFHPAGSISRQAMAAILFRYANADPEFDPPAVATFPDVPTGHTFFEEVEWLASTGITGGFSDGTFRPGSPVTRQSGAAFLFRYHWYAGT
jgi:Tol biopolymer transport system component